MLTIQVAEAEADEERLDELTRGLREELLELDVDSVSALHAGPAPEGSKGLELAAVGALIVTLQNSAELVEKVVSVVRSWLHRGSSERRSLKLTVGAQTLELAGATDAQQQRLIDAFVGALSRPERIIDPPSRISDSPKRAAPAPRKDPRPPADQSGHLPPQPTGA